MKQNTKNPLAAGQAATVQPGRADSDFDAAKYTPAPLRSRPCLMSSGHSLQSAIQMLAFKRSTTTYANNVAVGAAASSADGSRYRRPGATHRSAYRRLDQQRPRPSRRRAWPCKNARAQDARLRDRSGFSAPAIHARHAAGGHRRHHDLQPARRLVQHQARSGFREPDPGGRNQSRAGQGAKRIARSDAGTPGHARR